MSNITIVERPAELEVLPSDIPITRLDTWAAGGVFTGTYAGPGLGEIQERFEDQLAQLFAVAETPRLSGVQIKAPMYLHTDGRLTPSVREPFTHILKPAGTSGFEALPLVEWLCLELGRAAGFTVPSAALVPMPGGMPPALIVERFDIRVNAGDRRRIALEDFCSVLNLPPGAKYDATFEQVARATRPVSTDAEEDALILFRRALFAWLIADGDMHLKNMAFLKVAEPGAIQFNSVRFSPLYDAVTTRVFPRLAHDRMALKLNGKDNRLRRADFQTFAKTMGLKADAAEEIIQDTHVRLRQAAETIVLPALPSYGPNGQQLALRTLDVCRSQLTDFIRT